jgi:hypothetical protein
VIRTEEEHLAHIGVIRRSGRYPWGSGDPQRNIDFLASVKKLRKEGMSETEIAKGMGISVADLRAKKTIALDQQKQADYLTARRHRDDGWGYSEIGRRMGKPESSIRAILARGEKDTQSVLQTTANMLRDQVNEKSMLDIGIGVEKMIGVTRTRFDTAVSMLKEEGYRVHEIFQPQQNLQGKYTRAKVLTKPDITKSHVETHREDVRLIQEHSIDYGRSYLSVQPPLSVNPRRIRINYGDQGGKEADGVIYVRPGVKDLAIGSNRYGQVRILVDGTHYLKGMAVYKDDLPPGVDLVFNTKAANTGRKKDAMKPIDTKGDPDNPFGSIIRQVHGPDGKITSAMNLVGSPTKEGSGEEGSWDKWSTNLSSQMLSKQNPKLAKQQLDLTYDRRVREFDEIKALTNPIVRKDLLNKFADSTDSSASHLEAAALPRTATKVLLPIPTMKPDEIYAPHLNNGERVVLIRHPHGGTFEIPELTVNNKNREARRILGKDPEDAVGIHSRVAERLSGADFDGDTVLVIPNPRGSVEHTPALQGLKGFDPQVYKIPKDSKIPPVTNRHKQNEMGSVSNLITDMTLHGADTEKLSRAIRHSMVVIDSEKHQLDWRQSEKDHGILALKEEYQGRKRGGASTLISRAGAETHIPERRPRPPREGGPIDPVTGKKVFVETGRMKVERKRTGPVDPRTGKKTYVTTGRSIPITEKHRRLSVADDAFTLIPKERTPIPMEVLYANHSNKLKALANDARKEALPLKGNPQSESAKKVYAKEVKSLNDQLDLAERNAPYERHAQRLAQSEVSLLRQANPGMEKDEVTKAKAQALTKARIRTGAKKTRIDITQPEWDAIQAGAISTHKLKRILNNTDADSVKKLAMPKTTPVLTGTKLRRAQQMEANGFTQAEIADALGIGLTTLKVGLNE